MKNRVSALAAGLAAVSIMGMAGIARANSVVVQWNSGAGSNGHYYQRIDVDNTTTLTFDEAKNDAAALTYTVGAQTLHGHLAIFDTNYTEAFDFVRDSVVYASTGTGAAGSNETYWVGASSPDGAGSTNNNWTWINGAAVPDAVVSGWNIDRYETGGGAAPEGIGYYQSGSSQLWDYIADAHTDIAYGYVVEFAPATTAVPLPATLPAGLALLALCGLGLTIRRKKHVA